MTNKLRLITREHMLQAFNKIDQEGIQKDNENLYWLIYAG
ncbi:hypothetical protein Mucpa_0264 [Mucilaginibacter paludis DSM 18603]|uniref:Uncharacterized protein n=1 Tax=Mucilaginibacter paludis DSM 18603 TaxID=714943 RepID=H1YFQ9_9SPHI|nr:hypothetical protein Mucpa_0264 [Mucilaginibacter paludis DSM 18603]